MAFLIPSYIPDEAKSNAEKKIFNIFLNDVKTKNWQVLYSVGLSEHKRFVYGEIDFIVLAPNLGFFCLEVKGGRVSRKDGIWTFTDRHGHSDSTARGPFQQAEEGFFSIRGYLQQKLCEDKQYLLNCVSGIGVMFPDIEYSSVGSDDAKEMVFDATSGNDVYSYIENLASYTESKMHNKGLHPFRPTEQDILDLRNAIRGDFSFDFSRIANEQLSLAQIEEITRQQSQALSLLHDNNQCLYYGHAGTGKTFLAIETASRLCRKGLCVGFFCYNKALATWLLNVFSTEENRPKYIGTLHNYIFSYFRTNETIHDWKKYASDKLQNNTVSVQFDAIVIDEAQDIVTPAYMLFLSSILKNGLKSGRIYLFGDFGTQNIYEDVLPSYEKINLLKLCTDKLVQFQLTLNCRNTRKIHQLVSFAYDINESNWKTSNINGPDYQLIQSQDTSLETIINKLLKDGVEKKKITILSPYTYDNSRTCKNVSSHIRIDSLNVHSENITFSTIKSYKGLENDYIIVCDVDEKNFNETLYVALTRARYLLIVIGTEKLFRRMLKIDAK